MRIGPLPDTDRLSARRLGEQSVGLAASPAYLQRVGPIERIEDLAGHRGIAYRCAHSHRTGVTSPLVLDDLQAVADAAIAGVG
ncbi:LysR substrate-binding domain-containing protein, partial [Enterococcus faecalis]|uniref:LysR substrate-binding domain-containing protein n=1 Tax=Enterococcus faecalis TaxID=1351 RepID=UPI003CC513C3